MIRHDQRGSLWRKWDLHFHTPSSHDYQNSSVTNQQIIDGLTAAGISVVAITDHHVMDVVRIRELQHLAGDKLTVLPGMELCSELGGSESVHYIAIFPEDCDLDDIRTKLEGRLDLTLKDIEEKGHENICVPIQKGAQLIHELGGIVTVHAGHKANSIEKVSNNEPFKRRLKKKLLNECFNVLEVGRANDVDDYNEIVFPAIGARRPLIIASDNHDIKQYKLKTECWIKADCTFKGLKHMLHEPEDRVFVGSTPPLIERVDQNKTKFVKRLQVKKNSDSTLQEKWFDFDIPVNAGLIAIIGNKGSGKSALADIVALLGDTQFQGSFSFLNEEKFRNPRGNRAAQFDAELTWHSNHTVQKKLSDEIDETAFEAVKYLPQSHLETICNEIPGTGKTGFESELRSVIFSHVSDAERLGTSSLDELLEYHTSERQSAIELLRSELEVEIRKLVSLESMASSTYKTKVENELDAKKQELRAHRDSKPIEVTKPGNGNSISKEDAEKLQVINSAIQRLTAQIKAIEASKSNNARRLAAAKRLFDRVKNLESHVQNFKFDSADDCAALDIKIDDILKFAVSDVAVKDLIERYANLQGKDDLQLDEDVKDSIAKQLGDQQTELSKLNETLNKPNQLYQRYLARIKVWNATETKIIGNDEMPDTIKFIEAQLKELEEIRFAVQAKWDSCVSICRKIYGETDKLSEAYRDAFKPVDEFVNSLEDDADQKLELEFVVQKTPASFDDEFLSFLNQSRKGSFMGRDEGRKLVKSLRQQTDFESEENVIEFVTAVRERLVKDHRNTPPTDNEIPSQLAGRTTSQKLYEFLVGLEFLEPQYTLRWEGKDIDQLSPGERGTLLLVFYLRIDKSNIPLVIDQPEENLDNQTVYRILVPSIKDAKGKRQIFVVTHNPNLAVVCDADQIICASLDKNDGNSITYLCGSIENPAVNEEIVKILEGTRPAFDNRDGKYRVHV